MENKVKTNQRMRILDYLKTHDGITQYDAIKNISVMRLASRISEMKKLGYDVRDSWINGKNKYGEKYRAKKYWIERVE